MHSILETTLNKINTNKHRKLKILAQPIHESYQTLLSETGHEFYLIQGQGIKTWDFHTKPLPKNTYLIEKPIEEGFPVDIDFDLLLSQERFGNLQRFLKIKQQLGLPLVHVDHTMPPPDMPEKGVQNLASLRADKHVYITQFNKDAWFGKSEDFVIPHGINTDIFSGWQPNSNQHGISVVNLFQQRDRFCGWNLWYSVAQERKIGLVGENPGLSKSASSTDELVSLLRSSSFFLNTSQWSPVPLSLLEAMSVGMPIISSSKQEIPKVIKHMQNGILADTKEEILFAIDLLLKDKDLAKTLGQNARQTILENFSMDQFVKNWNNLFYSVVNS